LPADVVFLSKSKDSDDRIRNNICADVVFVVTPDATHCDVAEEWLGRAKMMFIEKPFDASFKRALDFTQLLKQYPETLVYNIDHYFIKAFPFFRNKPYLMGLIGNIVSARFFLLESQNIDPNRASSLVKGMIFDLGSHGFSIYESIGELSTINLLDIFAASYEDSPIPTETFAYIPFYIQSGYRDKTRSEIIVGKSHKKNQKYIELCGSIPDRKLKLDFARNEILFKTPEMNDWILLMPLFPDAHAYMINHIVSGLTNGFVEKKGIFLNLRQALQILSVLDTAQSAIKHKGIYTEGQNWENIMEGLIR
jgi:hypothetical protein